MLPVLSCAGHLGRILAELLFQVLPEVFNGVEIWGLCRPKEVSPILLCEALGGQISLGKLGGVLWIIVLLENIRVLVDTIVLHSLHEFILQDLNIQLCIQTTINFGDKTRPFPCHAAPNHDVSTSMFDCRQNPSGVNVRCWYLGIPPRLHPNVLLAIRMKSVDFGLICPDHSLPILHSKFLVLACKLQSGFPVLFSKHGLLDNLFGLQSCIMEGPFYSGDGHWILVFLVEVFGGLNSSLNLATGEHRLDIQSILRGKFLGTTTWGLVLSLENTPGPFLDGRLANIELRGNFTD